MDFSVLGPLRVIARGGPLEVPGAKERTLLAHLLSRGGRMVPASELAESLWGDSPPRSAAKSLQNYVLRLRNALEPDRAATPGGPRLLVTDGGGYRLAIEPTQLDAERFAQLVAVGRDALAQARPAAAASTLDEALRLWRGPAYAGFEDTAFGRSEARRLSELRWSATEDLWTAHVSDGRVDAVPDLERLVAEEPLRERLWVLLVLSLYRAGRQGAALDAWTRARDVLVAELGVEPGPELREVHRRVLAQDPSLDLPPRVGALPRGPGTAAPMVGRHAEMARLRDAWSRARAGASVVVALVGPTGAGATRLAEELVREAGVPGAAAALTDQGQVRLPAGAGMLTLLLRPASPPPGAEVLEVGPLGRDDVRRLASAYFSGDVLEDHVDVVLHRSGGWPGRAHAACRSLVHASAAEQVDQATRVVGVSRAALASARTELADGVVQLRSVAAAAPAGRDTCPWRGLSTYDVDDAPWFCGRERAVAELVARVAGARAVAVCGASGSGKSSLVRAGLVAALAEDVVPGGASWRRLVMRPGRHPMTELARQALGEPQVDAGDLLAGLVRGDDAGTATQTLLVVDQLEEVWTTCSDEAERASFLGVLGELVADARGGVRVVLVVRADYVAHLAEHPALAGSLADDTVLLGTMTPDETRRVVEQPAARAGLTLAEGLADAVVTDAGSEPGLLPLVSACLTRLWAAREGRRLTLGGYVAMGGLHGAIARVAEDAIAGLPAEALNTARILLLRLAGPGEGHGVVRRRVPVAELFALDLPQARQVVAALVEARLLSAADGHVEVAHEALFRTWPRLVEWLVEDASGRAVQRRLALAAAEWDAEGREPSALWRGNRLLAATEVARVRPEELTPTEAAFVDASREAVTAEQRADALRAAATQRQNRRLRALLALAVLLVAVAAVASHLVLRSRSETEEARTVAEAQRLAATALNVEHPDLALLTALEAVRVRADPQTYGALLTLLARQPDVITRVRVPTRLLFADATEDGGVVVLGDNGDRVLAVDADRAEVLWQRDLAGRAPTSVSVGAGSQVLVTASDGTSSAVAVLDGSDGSPVWEVTDVRLAEALPPSADPHPAMAVEHASGAVALTTSTHAVLLDAVDGRVRHVRAWAAPFLHDDSLRAWPDGRLSIAVDDVGRAVVEDPRRPRRPSQRLPGTPYDVAPDGRVALVSQGSGGLRLEIRAADLRRLSARWPLAQDEVWDVGWTPDGRRLLVTDGERLDVHHGRTAEPLHELVGHSGEVMAARVAGTGLDRVWTAGRDGTAVAFDLTGGKGIVRTRAVDAHGLAGSVAAAGDVALYTTKAGAEPPQPRLVDPGSGEDLGALSMAGLEPSRCRCRVATTRLTPDGRLALAGLSYQRADGSFAGRGALVVWDVASRRQVDRVDTPWAVLGLAVTPDGRTAALHGRSGWAAVDLRRSHVVAGPTELPAMDWRLVSHNTAVSHDGRTAALGHGPEVFLADLRTGEVVGRHVVDPTTSLLSVVWGPHDATLVLGSHDGRVFFLDPERWTEDAPTRQVTGGFLLDLATSDDGAHLATLGGDGDVTLWDTATWRPYGQPLTDDRGLGWTYFTPGGAVLRTFYESGLVTEVDVRPTAWVEAACLAANRDLTADETAQVLPDQPVRPTCPD